MNLNHLQYFIEVVSCKSMNKAAANLYITQPALTLALRTLEEEIGVKLLERSYSGAIPTKEGQAIYEDAVQIVSMIDKWSIYNSKNQYVKVHFYVLPVIYNTIIHEIVLHIAENEAKYDIELYEKRSFDIMQNIKKDNEIAFGFSYIAKSEFDSLKNNAEKEGFTVDLLFQDEFQVYIHQKHPLAQKEYFTKDDLSHLIFCSYIQERKIDIILKPLFNQKRFYRLSNDRSILEMVKLNKAVAVFPGLLKKEQSIKTVSLKLDNTDVKIVYYLIYKKRKGLAKDFNCIASMLKNFLHQYEYIQD